MFDLPVEIQRTIYSFDNTFREIYDECMKSVKGVSEKRFKIKFVEWNRIYFSEKKCFRWRKKENLNWRKRPISIFGVNMER
jgi:hypothetical protein